MPEYPESKSEPCSWRWTHLKYETKKCVYLKLKSRNVNTLNRAVWAIMLHDSPFSVGPAGSVHAPAPHAPSTGGEFGAQTSSRPRRDAEGTGHSDRSVCAPLRKVSIRKVRGFGPSGFWKGEFAPDRGELPEFLNWGLGFLVLRILTMQVGYR